MIAQADDTDGDWTQLGLFGGVEVDFVRELLDSEAIAYTETWVPGRRGARCQLWVAASEHGRAVALLAEAQEQAEASARSAAVISEAEASKWASVAKPGASKWASVAEPGASKWASVAEPAAEPSARRVSPREKPASREKRAPTKKEQARREHPGRHVEAPSERGVLVVALMLATLILTFATIAFVGERYGSYAPVAGRSGTIVACKSKYQVLCD
jgi:hypothetical protein